MTTDTDKPKVIDVCESKSRKWRFSCTLPMNHIGLHTNDGYKWDWTFEHSIHPQDAHQLLPDTKENK